MIVKDSRGKTVSATFRKHERCISLPIRDVHVTSKEIAVCVPPFRRQWQKRYVDTPKRLGMRRTGEPKPLFGHSSRADQALLSRTTSYQRWLPNRKRSSRNEMIHEIHFRDRQRAASFSFAFCQARYPPSRFSVSIPALEQISCARPERPPDRHESTTRAWPKRRPAFLDSSSKRILTSASGNTNRTLSGRFA